MSEQRNRRKAARRPVHIPIEYLGNRCNGTGMVINVSPFGVLIRGDHRPMVGTYVSLQMFPPDAKEPLSIERAVVRWQREFDMGVEIITMVPEAHARLSALMTAILQDRGCLCAPKLPWLCRCQAA